MSGRPETHLSEHQAQPGDGFRPDSRLGLENQAETTLLPQSPEEPQFGLSPWDFRAWDRLVAHGRFSVSAS